MLYDYKYDNGVRIKIWEDECPFDGCEIQKKLVRKFHGKQSNSENEQKKIIIVELMLPGNHNNYGMLGLEYRDEGNETNIIINVNDYKGELYETNIAVMPDIVHKGIPEHYVDAIIKSVEDIQKEKLKCGKYVFNIGAHGEVGSSKNIFYIITNILFRILDVNLIENSVIEKIIQEEVLNN